MTAGIAQLHAAQIGTPSCELTQKVVSLLPMLLAMIDWSVDYDADTAAPADFIAAYRADPVAFTQEPIR